MALAGVNQQSDADEFKPLVVNAFNMFSHEFNVKITNDTDLLASPALKHDDTNAAIAIIAGTGTNGMAFMKSDDRSLKRIGVSRGWGYLLGDEGSAFSIGRSAIQSLLSYEDFRNNQKLYRSSIEIPSLDLHKDLMKQLQVDTPANLINKAYVDHSEPDSPSFTASETNRKCWIAEASRQVFKYAFDNKNNISPIVIDNIINDCLIGIPIDPTPSTFSQNCNDYSQIEALKIASQAICPLVHMVVGLLGDRSVIKPETTTLTVGGGVISNDGYRSLLLRALETHFDIKFKHVQVVNDAEGEGVQALASQYKPLNKLAKIKISTPPQSPSKKSTSLNATSSLSPSSPTFSIHSCSATTATTTSALM